MLAQVATDRSAAGSGVGPALSTCSDEFHDIRVVEFSASFKVGGASKDRQPILASTSENLNHG